jgi:hypothetical protein
MHHKGRFVWNLNSFETLFGWSGFFLITIFARFATNGVAFSFLTILIVVLRKNTPGSKVCLWIDVPLLKNNLVFLRLGLAISNFFSDGGFATMYDKAARLFLQVTISESKIHIGLLYFFGAGCADDVAKIFRIRLWR